VYLKHLINLNIIHTLSRPVILWIVTNDLYFRWCTSDNCKISIVYCYFKYIDE